MDRTLLEALNALDKALTKVETIAEKKSYEKKKKTEKAHVYLRKIFEGKEEEREKIKVQLNKNELIIEQEERELDNLTEELVRLEISGETAEIPRKEKMISSKRQSLNEIKNKQKAYHRLLNQSHPFKQKEKARVLDAISLFSDITISTDEVKSAAESIEKMKITLQLLENVVTNHMVGSISKQEHDKEKEINKFLNKYFKVNSLLKDDSFHGRILTDGQLARKRNELVRDWLNSEEDDLTNYSTEWYERTERVGL